MKKVLKFLNRYKWRLLVTGIIVVALACATLAFRFLVKVGNVKYLYNYQNDTRGSLPVEQSLSGANNANQEVATYTEMTDPKDLAITTRIQVNGEDVTSYERKDKIHFSKEASPLELGSKGMLTFRGDYHRNASAFGTADISQKVFDPSTLWSFQTGKVLKGNGVDYWSGNGWTGQPLVVQWDEETKQIMNLYDAAKRNRDLVEVIYAGMDGHIHFLDLATGEPTRDPINVGMTFKGTASIYPGGVPMMIVGSGDAQPGMYGESISPRVFIYSLIDGKKLYEFGMNDPIAPRVWHAFDSSGIIDANSDTLICPGENGVLYTLKLNTKYDKKAGTLSIDPTEEVRAVYSATRNSEDGMLWGSECSASVYDHYLYLGDNGGIVYCIDLNTMELVWAQDVYDDVNSSIIFDIEEDGSKYIYAATTLKYQTNEHNIGEANVFKINAMTGEIVWRKPYECHTVKGLAGGFLATGIAGKGQAKDLVYYFVSKTPELDGGYLVALNKATGEEVWRLDPGCDSWSSTSIVYSKDGTPYLIQGGYDGTLMLVDALTGEIYDRIYLGGGGIEATCAIFDNRVVVGTRNEKIVGVTIR